MGCPRDRHAGLTGKGHAHVAQETRRRRCRPIQDDEAALRLEERDNHIKRTGMDGPGRRQALARRAIVETRADAGWHGRGRGPSLGW